MPECFIRGSTIKYLRIPDEVRKQLNECPIYLYKAVYIRLWICNAEPFLMNFFNMILGRQARYTFFCLLFFLIPKVMTLLERKRIQTLHENP